MSNCALKKIMSNDVLNVLLAVEKASLYDRIARPMEPFNENDRQSYEKSLKEFKKRSNELWAQAQSIRDRIQAKQNEAGQ